MWREKTLGQPGAENPHARLERGLLETGLPATAPEVYR